MAAPLPPTNHDGADGEDAEPSAVPKSAEDRKAAAALSSVSARDDDTAKPLKEADQEALGKAIQALDFNGSGTPKGEEQKEIKKKVVKVDPDAVALLVSYVSEGSDYI